MSTNVAGTGYDYSKLNGSGSSTGSSSSAQEISDRFLRLLVAQVQNQDPMSPMENSEVTSQMAQINMVTGIEGLNSNFQALSTQMLKSQMLQGASLVGHDVVVPGSKLAIADGVGRGAFELAGAADSVVVEVVSASGKVVQSIDMGAQSSGSHAFAWESGEANNDQGLSFRIKATSGAVAVQSTSLSYDRVAAVSTSGNTLLLELQNLGQVKYDDVRSIN